MKKTVKLVNLTPYEIIMAMVEGLRHPKTKIRMSTYGGYVHGECCGCAATNALLYLYDVDAKAFIPENRKRNYRVFDDPHRDVDLFESAINWLRMGELTACNRLLEHIEMHTILNPNDLKLPVLKNDYTEEQLMIYEQLANDNKPT